MSDPVGEMHHVGIVVRDLDRAEAFFTEALGLEVVNRVALAELRMRAVFFAAGPALIELVEFSDPDLVRERLGDRIAAIDHIALQVDDVEEAERRLAEHGVETAAPEPIVVPSGRVHVTKAESSAGISFQLSELSGS